MRTLHSIWEPSSFIVVWGKVHCGMPLRSIWAPFDTRSAWLSSTFNAQHTGFVKPPQRSTAFVSCFGAHHTDRVSASHINVISLYVLFYSGLPPHSQAFFSASFASTSTNNSEITFWSSAFSATFASISPFFEVSCSCSLSTSSRLLVVSGFVAIFE